MFEHKGASRYLGTFPNADVAQNRCIGANQDVVIHLGMPIAYLLASS